MIIGLGTDLIEVARIAAAAERRGPALLERLFTAREIGYCETRHYRFESFAARFAAKEAFLKALGTGVRDGISWHDIEVVRDALGRPELRLTGRALELAEERGVSSAFVSLSHTRSLATAVVVLES
jgi:holo-[acyl-carrier protein] synthase